MCMSSNEYTERDYKIDLSKIAIEVPKCKECEDWMHTRLWIGYKFCPYCGRKLDLDND